MQVINKRIAIIGLGYVGLPLLVAFSKKYKIHGFDIDKKRIRELKKYFDRTYEVSKKNLANKNIYFTSNIHSLRNSNIFIITVPTPIDKYNNPDLKHLIKASKIVGSVLKNNDLVIIESTVYPGTTEEVCVPILEKKSNLKFNIDFFCGYSPERINPGDSKYNLTNILKITSGSTKEVADFVDKLYSKIILAGTYKVSSIQVAEAAKVIENCQRDINVAFVNELAMLFDKMKINTQEVLRAASTKWNFIDFKPGLVGGHCIGVDPYYLTYKAKQMGYHSKIILSGRRVNSSMGAFVVKKLINKMKTNKIKLINSKILIMGFSFKENCSDIRNTRVIDIINELKKRKSLVDIYDPIVDKKFCKREYNIKLIKYPMYSKYDSIIIAVAHNEFQEIGIDEIRNFGKKNCIIFDIKCIFNNHTTDLTL